MTYPAQSVRILACVDIAHVLLVRAELLFTKRSGHITGDLALSSDLRKTGTETTMKFLDHPVSNPGTEMPFSVSQFGRYNLWNLLETAGVLNLSAKLESRSNQL